MNEEEEFSKLEALKAIPGFALKGLQKYGEGLDWTNDQVNIRNALRMNPAHQIGSRITGKDAFSEENTPDWLDNVLDYSYKDARDDISGGAGWAAEKLTGSKTVGQGAELLGQVLLPDAVDFATGGVGYLDNLGRLPGALKKISAKDGARIVEDVFSRSRFKAGEVYRSAEETVKGVAETITHPVRSVQDLAHGLGGTGGSRATQGELPLQRFQNVPYQVRVTNKMAKYGMKNGVMDLKALDSVKLGSNPLQTQRSLIQDYLSPSEIAGNFDGFKRANQPEFAALWSDFLEAKGLKIAGPGTDIQVHHINPLFDSIHLFDGVTFNSKQYWDVIETLIQGNARTGVIHRGEAVNNLMMTLGKGKAVDTPHGIAHKYLNTQTPTFFSSAEMRLMKENPAYRLQKAEEWAVIVNKSEQTILEAHKQWSLLNPKISANLSFDELVDTLSEYTDTGYSKLLDPEFQLPDFNRIITKIANDKGLKGPIFQLKPKPVDLRKVSQRERMIKEADIAKETKLADKQLRELQNPKPDPNPGQTELDL